LAPNASLDVNGDGLMARAEVSPRGVMQAPKARVRIMRYALTDQGWAASSPMLPNKPRGIPRVNDRRVFAAIFVRGVLDRLLLCAGRPDAEIA
jgi:hypothetical protein